MALTDRAGRTRMVADIAALIAKRDDLNYHIQFPKASRDTHKALVTSSKRHKYFEYGLVLARVYGIRLDQSSCPLRATATHTHTNTHASEFWFRQELVKLYTFQKGPISISEAVRFLPAELQRSPESDRAREYADSLLKENELLLKDLYQDRLLPLLLDWCQKPGFLDVDTNVAYYRLEYWQECLLEDLPALVWMLEPVKSVLNLRYLFQVGDPDDKDVFIKREIQVYFFTMIVWTADYLYVRLTENIHVPRFDDGGALEGYHEFLTDLRTFDTLPGLLHCYVPLRFWPSYPKISKRLRAMQGLGLEG